MAEKYEQSSSALPSPGPNPAKSSTLSNKLSTVLSASYADLEIRDALEILDARNIQNTPEIGRRLNLDVQKEVIESNGVIIKEFAHVAEQLKRIERTINSLNQCCEHMRRQVSAAHQETGLILEEASAMTAQKEKIEKRQRILNAFTAHFFITDAESLLLSSSAEPVESQFFALLSRVNNIYKDCQILLGTENQSLGLEIMEQTSKLLNSGFQKLFRWIQREFKTLDLENPQINSSIRRALRVLAERPTLFQSCLDFFAEAREHILSDSFHAALTGTQNSSEEVAITKPIDFFAHDPLRYVGDMLAWTHSAAVSEREALEVLFISDGDEIAKEIQAGIDSEPWAQAEDQADGAFDGYKALNNLVNRDLSGVARLLRQRVDQVIQGHEDPGLAYEISNLINFYLITFQKLLGQDSSVLTVLAELEKSVLRQFRVTIRDHVSSIQTEHHQLPPDFGAPEFLNEALDQLKTLIKSYDKSLAPISGREEGFRAVLSESLDPFITLCEGLADELQQPGKGIFILNCLIASKSTLESHPFTKERAEEIEEAIGKHSSDLAAYQHTFLLHTSGMNPLVAALAPLTDSDEDVMSIISLPAFQTKDLMETSRILDDFLPSALMDVSENLKQLKAPRLAQNITELGVQKFCKDFELVEDRIMAADEMVREGDPTNEADVVYLREAFPWRSGDIRVLLS
ncbi:MAG: Golgi transport complex subunit 6 [Trizodia sp. TS-e1964]|nr:MAG: Golgi transport complex subunit 6 [Trizodia sp. TS-e1964]